MRRRRQKSCFDGRRAPVYRVAKAAIGQIAPIRIPVVEYEHAAVFGAALAADRLAAQAPAIASGGQLQYDLGMRVWDATAGKPGLQVLIARDTILPAQDTAVLYTRRVRQDRLVLELVRRTGNDDAMEKVGNFSFGPVENEATELSDRDHRRLR